jgi:nucleotide-binding universal stress UspA family protein
MTYGKILVAVDGSPNAQRALDHAIALAARDGARLTVLHAVLESAPPPGLLQWARVEHLIEDERPAPETPSSFYGRLGLAGTGAPRSVPHRVRVALGQAILDAAVHHARESGVANVEPVLEDGDPAELIAEVQAAGGHDLLVLGTRGLGTLKGLLVGSVSQKALGLHACAVLVVP